MKPYSYKYLTYMAIGSAICGIITVIIGQELLKKTHTTNTNTIDSTETCESDDSNNFNTNNNISYTGYNGLIAGYSVIAFSIFFSMILSTTKGNADGMSEYLINNMLKMSLPSFITLGCIVYIIVLYSYNKNNIVNGKIVDEFHSYTLGINILMIFQIIVLGYYTLNINQKSGYIKSSKYMSYLINFVNLILIATQQSKLQYYSTDG
jgi:hypothetical protein